jgi:dTDP-4-amino-4,6-dideoxygalactose transaminase
MPGDARVTALLDRSGELMTDRRSVYPGTPAPSPVGPATADRSGDGIDPIRFHVPVRPDVDGLLEDVRQVVDSGWQSNASFVHRLEREIAPWIGGGEIIAVSNCSDGLIATLVGLGDPGGEVIVAGYTYLATWQSIIWARMVPVVADVTADGLLDPAAVLAAASPRTSAILAVHLAGAPAPMDALSALAVRLSVPLVADAAHAVGARLSGDRPVGATGVAQVFSIGATKQLAAGEGGLIALNDPELARRVRLFCGQGHLPGAMDALGPGMSMRLPEISAALALRQLSGLGVQLERRASIGARYAAAWSALPLRLSGPRPGDASANKDQLVWLDDPSLRSEVMAGLGRRGVTTKPYYDRAVADLTAFEGRVASTDVSRRLAASSFAVPIHGRLTDLEVEIIADAMIDVLAELE